MRSAGTIALLCVVVLLALAAIITLAALAEWMSNGARVTVRRWRSRRNRAHERGDRGHLH